MEKFARYGFKLWDKGMDKYRQVGFSGFGRTVEARREDARRQAEAYAEQLSKELNGKFKIVGDSIWNYEA